MFMPTRFLYLAFLVLAATVLAAPGNGADDGLLETVFGAGEMDGFAGATETATRSQDLDDLVESFPRIGRGARPAGSGHAGRGVARPDWQALLAGSCA